MRGGVAGAPDLLRTAGLVARLREFREVVDYGNVEFLPPTPERDPVSGIIAPESAVSMVKAVQGAVSQSFRSHDFPLVIGGDCPLLLGALAACQTKAGPVGLLFVDGHEDAYAPRESPTGELADMELGLALGRHLEHVPHGLVGPAPLVVASNVTILGARDADEIRLYGGKSLEPEVERFGVGILQQADRGEVVKRTLARLLERVSSVWLHVDLDVLSTAELSAVDYRQPGGLMWSELEEISRIALASGHIIGTDVTIYNPDLDPGHRQAGRIVRFLADMSSNLSERYEEDVGD
jgi:arginase